jgi:serine phosphatase RsbU (regulator of sigma subunit)
MDKSKTAIELPLGLDANAIYLETSFDLLPGAQLTLLTDGVVEAQGPTGELFGFDRTAAISSQSAESIASIAQSFGQEDDITVVTLSHKAAKPFA